MSIVSISNVPIPNAVALWRNGRLLVAMAGGGGTAADISVSRIFEKLCYKMLVGNGYTLAGQFFISKVVSSLSAFGERDSVFSMIALKILSGNIIRSKLILALLARGNALPFCYAPALGIKIVCLVCQQLKGISADPAISCQIAALLKSIDLMTQPPEKIIEVLQYENQAVLYPYWSQNHIVGLELTRSGEIIRIRVFNSGEGLWSHSFPMNRWKWQTMWGIQVPYTKDSLDHIRKLIERKNLEPIYCVYKRLRSIPDACDLTAERPVLQTSQKGENCSIEWIFAYLRNSLPEEKYHRLRIELFKKCLEWTDSEELKAELKRKIAKREAKLAALAVAGA